MFTQKLDHLPAWEFAKWDGGRLLNDGALPIWSGEGAPPAIGASVLTHGKISHECTITGYIVSGGWLMALAVRVADQVSGDLAGTEIRYPLERKEA